MPETIKIVFITHVDLTVDAPPCKERCKVMLTQLVV